MDLNKMELSAKRPICGKLSIKKRCSIAAEFGTVVYRYAVGTTAPAAGVRYPVVTVFPVDMPWLGVTLNRYCFQQDQPALEISFTSIPGRKLSCTAHVNLYA